VPPPAIGNVMSPGSFWIESVSRMKSRPDFSLMIFLTSKKESLSSVFFTSLLAILAAANPLIRRDASTVEADLATVSTNTKTLDTAVNAFSNTAGTLAQAFAIHTDATNLESAITKTTTDVKASGVFSEADGNAILTIVKALQPTIVTTLTDTVNKKAGFARVAATSIVLNDLQTLQSDTQALETAFLAATPTDLKPSASAIVSAINAAFASAVAAYSS